MDLRGGAGAILSTSRMPRRTRRTFAKGGTTFSGSVMVIFWQLCPYALCFDLGPIHPRVGVSQ